MTASKSRRIEPRAQTAPPGTRERSGWKRLPDDVSHICCEIGFGVITP